MLPSDGDLGRASLFQLQDTVRSYLGAVVVHCAGRGGTRARELTEALGLESMPAKIEGVRCRTKRMQGGGHRSKSKVKVSITAVVSAKSSTAGGEPLTSHAFA
ncbi:DUF2625 domain-containing protein [Streptomyces sp. NBC_01594]